MTKTNLGLLGVLMIPACITIALIAIPQSSIASYIASRFSDLNPSRPEGWVWAVAPCYCGESREATSDLYRSVAINDTTAVISLTRRGQAYPIGEYDQLRVVSKDGDMARVRILTGQSIGIRCWLPVGMLHPIVHPE